LLPEQLVPQEQRQPDPPVTFPVRLAAVERERPVARVRRVVVVERRAALAQLRTAVHSGAVVAAVVLAVAAAEQTLSMR